MEHNKFKIIIGGKDNKEKSRKELELKGMDNKQSINNSFTYSSIDEINLNDLRFKIKNNDGVYVTFYQEDFENGIKLETVFTIDNNFSFTINVYAPEKYSKKEYGNNLLHRVGTIAGMIKLKELMSNIYPYNLLEQLNDDELIQNASEEDNIYDCYIQELKVKADFVNTGLIKYLWSSLPGLIGFIYGTKIRCIVTDPANDSEENENQIETPIIKLISDLGYVKLENSTYWGINYLQMKYRVPEF